MLEGAREELAHSLILWCQSWDGLILAIALSCVHVIGQAPDGWEPEDGCNGLRGAQVLVHLAHEHASHEAGASQLEKVGFDAHICLAKDCRPDALQSLFGVGLWVSLLMQLVL